MVVSFMVSTTLRRTREFPDDEQRKEGKPKQPSFFFVNSEDTEHFVVAEAATARICWTFRIENR
ncbi:MAG: hypothetical protein WCF41_08740, partial [Pseudolabrys sp.]